MIADAAPVDQPDDFGEPADRGPALVRRRIAEIKAYERAFSLWEMRSNRIVKRYRDERDTHDNTGIYSDNSRRFNILWSNVSTLQPNLYLNTPKPEVSRRYNDADPVGRTAAMILERAVAFQNDVTDFDPVMKAVRDDYLLPGRGTAFVRYIPHFGDKVTPAVPLQMTIGPDQQPVYVGDEGQPIPLEMVKFSEDGQPYMDGESYEPVVWEETYPEYIPWRQFGHSMAPQWEKVTLVWHWQLMTREQLIERFGEEKGSKIPLNSKPELSDDEDCQNHPEVFKRAKIYELWDKVHRRVEWLSMDCVDDLLDMKEDPLKLSGFFPCPRPLYATMSTDSLIPVPDYIEYQDQAKELDELTQRIHLLTYALRMAGVYNGQFQELQRLMDSGAENIMIPVNEWAAFASTGGMQGAISWMPIDQIASVLMNLIQVREKIKSDLYEITGISDIVRGQSSAVETATAQRIKGNFATLRLQERQQDVQRFARDILRIQAEIISELFSDQTLAQMTGYGLSIDANPEMFKQAVALLRDDKMRTFRLDVESDSTIAADREQEKKDRVEFLQAAGGFMTQAVTAAKEVPQLAPLMGKMLMFAVRGFRAGRDMEQSMEEALKSLEQAPQQGGGADPAQAAVQQQAQVEMQVAQVRGQAEMAKAQAQVQKAQIDQQTAQVDAQAAEMESQARLIEAQARLEAAKMDAQIKRMEYQAKMAQLMMRTEGGEGGEIGDENAMGDVGDVAQAEENDQ